MADLVTTAEVVARVPRLASHPALAALVTSASRIVEDRCRRTFEQAAVTETHHGQGWSRLWLRRPPIASITSVTISGSAQPASDFYFTPETGELVWGPSAGDYRFGPKFPRGRANVVVAYVGGYAAVPDPVKEAAIQVVQTLADAAKTSSVFKSETILDYSYTLGDGEMRGLVDQMLAPYVLDSVY